MLATRLISAGILAPIVVAVALLGEPWLSSLVGLLVFLAMVELISLLDAGGFAPPQVVALAAGIGVAGAGLVAANQALVGGALADLLRATDPPGLADGRPRRGASCCWRWPGSPARSRATGSSPGRSPRSGSPTSALLAPFIVVVAHLAPAGGHGRDADRRAGPRTPAPPGCSSCCWWCGATTPAPT